MNKKLALAAALLAATTATQAQMVSYKKVTDDPDAYKRSVLYLDLFTADTYLQPALGSAIKAETVIADRLMPWANVRFAWSDAASHHVVTGYPTVDGGQKKEMITDLGLAFFPISRNAQNKRVKIVLSSFHTSSYTHTRYIRVPATVKRMFGPEGGINITRKALRFEDASHPFYHYQSTDGKTDLPIEDVGGTGTQPAGLAYAPQSMGRTMSVYGGIHYRKVTNVSISSDSYGYKSTHAVGDWYADVMVAPVISIANVVDVSGQEWKLVAQDGGKRHLGWRLGYSHHTSINTVGFAYDFEVGQRPGPVMGDSFLDNGSYIQFGMGLSIGSGMRIGGAKHKEK